MNGQAFVGPEISPGAPYAEAVTVKALSPLLAQAATDLTLSDELTYPLEKVTVRSVVPCPLTILTFAGTVHKYEVALLAGEIEYNTSVPCSL